jgi:hypothetical protein
MGQFSMKVSDNLHFVMRNDKLKLVGLQTDTLLMRFVITLSVVLMVGRFRAES